MKFTGIYLRHPIILEIFPPQTSAKWPGNEPHVMLCGIRLKTLRLMWPTDQKPSNSTSPLGGALIPRGRNGETPESLKSRCPDFTGEITDLPLENHPGFFSTSIPTSSMDVYSYLFFGGFARFFLSKSLGIWEFHPRHLKRSSTSPIGTSMGASVVSSTVVGKAS